MDNVVQLNNNQRSKDGSNEENCEDSPLHDSGNSNSDSDHPIDLTTPSVGIFRKDYSPVEYLDLISKYNTSTSEDNYMQLKKVWLEKDWLTPTLIREVNAAFPSEIDISNDGTRVRCLENFKKKISNVILYVPVRVQQIAEKVFTTWGMQCSCNGKKNIMSLFSTGRS